MGCCASRDISDLNPEKKGVDENSKSADKGKEVNLEKPTKESKKRPFLSSG
jgi:predicted phosphatase